MECAECGSTEFVLVETGYTRYWSTRIQEDGTIVAFYNGSDDWSETGAGDDQLYCSPGMHPQPVDLEGRVEFA